MPVIQKRLPKQTNNTGYDGLSSYYNVIKKTILDILVPLGIVFNMYNFRAIPGSIESCRNSS